VIPGEMTDVTLVFDQPGKYTFYCTRWCSVNHWRMRGTIEVNGPTTTTETVKPPLYVTLGLDIDAKHQAEFIPAERPSALRGELLQQEIPTEYQSQEYYQTHTPVELWKALRGESALQKSTDQDIWDLVAWVWKSNTTSQELQLGKQNYAVNCAACHGEQGGGNGVFANQKVKLKCRQVTCPPSRPISPIRTRCSLPAQRTCKARSSAAGWAPACLIGDRYSPKNKPGRLSPTCGHSNSIWR
jgi:hypothetical protein